MALKITLGDREFNTGVPDGNGATWWVTGYEGWDAPALAQSWAPRTGRDGAVQTEARLETRGLVLSGVVKAQGEAGYWTAYNECLALLNNLWQPRPLTVFEVPEPKTCGVLRGGTPRIGLPRGSSFEFELPLVAPDPLKYAVTEQTEAVAAGTPEGPVTTVVTAAGTFPSWPVLTLLEAGHVQLRHVESGLLLTTGLTVLPAGTVIDMGLARATAPDGSLRYSAFGAESLWWPLQPGPNSIRSRGAAVSVAWRDAYL